MSPEVIQRCLNERPFKPLTLSLTDHNEIYIDDPSVVELTADGSALVITRRDAHVLIALGQIITITIASRQGGAFGFGS